MKGGKGKAGWHKHKWSYAVKFEPTHFGKRGFLCPTGIGTLRTINVGDLDQQIDLLAKQDKVKIHDGKYHVNLEALGYDKLLGDGKVTHAIVLTADSCSEAAAKKIIDTGGQILRPEA